MHTLTTRVGQVAYEEQGIGVPLVLLHANPGDHRDYESILPVLSHQYRTIAVDWPSYGESPPPQQPRSASAMLMADVLEDIVAELGLEQALFLGNSIGGYAAARLAITHPECVRALVLVSPGGFTPHNTFTRLFCSLKGRELLTRWLATPFAKLYLKRRTPFVKQILARTNEERTLPSRIAVDAAVWRSFLHPDYDLRSRAAAIRVPTLLVFGRYDPVIHVNTDGRSAQASIPGAKCVVLDTGHEPFAEDPEAFLREVEPFLQTASLNGGTSGTPNSSRSS